MMIISIQFTLRSKPKLNYVFLNVNRKILHSLYFEIMHTYRQQNENNILKRNRPAFRIKCDMLLDFLLWTKEPVWFSLTRADTEIIITDHIMGVVWKLARQHALNNRFGRTLNFEWTRIYCSVWTHPGYCMYVQWYLTTCYQCYYL